jgi:hypothetical protein
MDLLIPNSNTVFNTKLKDLDFELEVVIWLNTCVYNKLKTCVPQITPFPLTVKGYVGLEVPREYYKNTKEFIKLVTEKLNPLGYTVNFGHDGVGGEVCTITWSPTI